MSSHTAGTFVTASAAAPSGGAISGTCMIPTGTTTMRLTVSGLDASNTVKTQKATSAGGAWSDVTTYNSDQSGVGITVAVGERWRLVQVTQQAIRDVRYSLTA